MEPKEYKDKAEQLYAYCLANSLLIVVKQSKDNPASKEITNAAITCVPTPFPKTFFEKAFQLMPYFNLLVHKLVANGSSNQDITTDDALIENTLLWSVIKKVSTYDQFTNNLIKCYYAQSIEFCVLRSDYMISECENTIKQVELNTMACSLFGLSSKLHTLHFQSPPNNSLDEIASTFKYVYDMYTTTYNVTECVILMIVQPDERNIFDHALIIDALRPLIIIKMFLHEVRSALDVKANEALLVDGHEVAIVYFRAGYCPEDFEYPNSWSIRAGIERSRAIKCPSIAIQLAGLKKIQEVLANHSDGQHFMSCHHLTILKSCFCKFWDPKINHESYTGMVLKPQREGGGNNVYNATDIKRLLESLGENERDAYVLQELIDAPQTTNTQILRDKKIHVIDCISELGIYGVLVTVNNQVHVNKTVGYLLRTKGSKEYEGGFVHGISALDCPLLI